MTVSTIHNDLVARAKEITAREKAVYSERTKRSQMATERASKVMPAGVPSSFQAYDPHPIVVKHAAGSRMIDVDGNEYVDYDMGFGALFAGHMNPAVRRARSRPSSTTARCTSRRASSTPRSPSCSPTATGCRCGGPRTRAPRRRWTPSALARGVTGREKIVKVEGGYHGHHDEVMISIKPPLDQAGPADAPHSIPQLGGDHAAARSTTSSSIPYNDRRRARAGPAGRRRGAASSSSR